MTLQSDFSAKITKVKTALENVFVKKTDITTSFSSTTSDSKIPSEKLVKNSLDDKISKSQTSGLVKNDGTIDRTNYLSSLPSHNHDDRYYTETEIDTALNGKANSSHPHSISDITSLQTSLNDKIEASDLLELIYPKGSIYMSMYSTDPSTLFGGTWVQIKDTFLLACGDSYSPDSNADTAQHGSATVTLTINQIPSHNHQTGYRQSYGAGNAAGLIAYSSSASIGNLNTTSTGGGKAHNNMPPYMAVYVWKRTG